MIVSHLGDEIRMGMLVPEERLAGDLWCMVVLFSRSQASTMHQVGLKRLLKEWFYLMNNTPIVIHHISCLLYNLEFSETNL